MALLLLLTTAAYADCSLPRTVAELDAAMVQAEVAWGENPASFADEMDVVGNVLGCVNAPLPAPSAARLLRLDGLAAFARRETERSAAAFSGARSIDPGITLPASMADSGNPLRAVWDTPAPARSWVTLRAPAKGKLYLDGVRTSTAPAERPFVFQAINGVYVTAAVATTGSLPAYARAPHPARNPLLVTAGVAAVASGVLYGLAWVSHDAAVGAANQGELGTAEAENHTYVIASASAGGLAAVALGGAIVVARW
ncbi:hypothetical protein LBMAG42_29830 [Deltaproteobacteria bacterium]|nr:hypothetical protein LBMAG42_29830 [Deltaproteobacteria bacterium]